MSILQTSKVQCKDCYRCLRSCAVKAIKVADNHAQIWDEACILDGACIAACPQNAKRITLDSPAVKELVKSRYAVAGVAPSYRAAYGREKATRLAGVLRQLGFKEVRNTAEVAGVVADEHISHCLGALGPVISSSCPAVVSLVEKHFPDLIHLLAPVLSPMALQARQVKALHGQSAAFVFVGPCLAKKAESLDMENAPYVDGVISFRDVEEWAEEAGLDWEACGKAEMVDAPPSSRSFPLEGGLLTAARKHSWEDKAFQDLAVIPVSGTEACLEALMSLRQAGTANNGPLLLEMFACSGGCVNGPLMPTDTTELTRRTNLVSLLSESESPATEALPQLGMSRGFSDRRFRWEIPSEKEISAILARTGKRDKVDELNCGACGYNTCREKAVAVYNGVAEAEMCIPYMRKRAESMANVILGATPNGIIALDTNLRILFLNPAAERMFQVSSERATGEPVDWLLPRNHFAAALKTRQLKVVDEVFPKYNLATRQYIVHVPEQDMVLGIFIDVTNDLRHRTELDTLKKTTLSKAQEVIDKQMRVAQEIAGLLGETTAETKVLLTKLIKLMQEDGPGGLPGAGGGNSRWNT